MGKILNPDKTKLIVKARKLVAQNDFEKSLKLVDVLVQDNMDLQVQSTSIQARFSEYKKRRNIGDLPEAELEIKRNKIGISILELIRELEKLIENGFPNGNDEYKLKNEIGSEPGPQIIDKSNSIGSKNNIQSHGRTTININRRFISITIILTAVIIALLYFWPEISPPILDYVSTERCHPDIQGEWIAIDGNTMVKQLNIGPDFIGFTGFYVEGYFKNGIGAEGLPKTIFFRTDSKDGNEIRMIDQNTIEMDYQGSGERIGYEIELITVTLKRKN